MERKVRVLIVEDEALVAMEVEEMVRLAGHEPVGLADDLSSALDAADDSRPDLALVDIQLARGDSGMDVAARFGERGVPVIFTTGNCPAEKGRGLAMGCLHKPYSEKAMLETLAIAQGLLDGRHPASMPPALHLY